MYSVEISKFISTLTYKNIPQEVILRAKELILDCIGVGIAGGREKSVQNAIKTIKKLPGGGGECKIWGQNAKFAPNYATMINAISSHALDFDDTHTEAIVHASAILTPLCLTYMSYLKIPKRRILTAFVAGWEVAARLGIASKGSFHKRGFHTTAIAGIFGATAAICVALRLKQEECVNALGLAASYASGINEFLSNGSNSKVIHVANCVNNAILAVNFAKNAMSGPVSIFEGRDNIFKSFGIESECDKSELIRGFNKIWQIMQVSIKPYPSCHFAHGLIDCAILLRKDGLKSDDIKSIKCYVDEVPVSFICDPIEIKYAPKTAYEAKFSMPFLMATAFFDGELNLKSYENLNRAEVVKLAKKITYEKRKNEGFPKYFPGHIEAALKDGKIIKKDVFINRGNFDNPLSFDEIFAKFRQCASIKFSEKRLLAIKEAVKNYESSEVDLDKIL